MTATRPAVGTRLPGAVGDSPLRPDGVPKVTGEFAYSSDLWVEGMLWGATARSPHPRARIRGLDLSAARAVRGVQAVLTAADVPGDPLYGLEHADQPVLAADEVRYHGEPVAVVAADDPDTARRAAALVAVDWEELPAVTDMRRALDPDTERVHPGGNLVRQVLVRRGDAAAPAEPGDIVVTGEYEVGMQDQAFLGPESGLAVPAEDGGVELHVATQWLHADRRQIAACLGLPEDKVRLLLAGVGGAFGGREDLSMQVHACLLALRTGRPVKMVYTRDESFLGHVHRHPAVLRYEHRRHRGRPAALRAGATSCSTAARTRPPRPRWRPTRPPWARGRTTCRRGHRLPGRLHQQPAVRGDARLRRGAGLLRVRVADGQAGRGAAGWTRWRCGSATPCGRARWRPAARWWTARRRWPSCSAGSRPRRCRRRCRPRRTRASCPAASPAPPAARAWSAASATASASRTSASPRASTTTPPPGSGSRWSPASRRCWCTRPRPRSARA